MRELPPKLAKLILVSKQNRSIGYLSDESLKMQKVLLRKNGLERSHVHFLDEIFSRHKKEETFILTPFAQANFLGRASDYDFQLRHTYAARYNIYLNIGDFKTKDIIEDYIKPMLLDRGFSLRRARYFAVRKALEKFENERPIISEQFKQKLDTKVLNLPFLNICDRYEINYPNFVVLEIERFMLLNWMLIHPNNYFNVFVELLFQNIERVMVLDWVYRELLRYQMSADPHFNIKDFQFEIPTNPNCTDLIDFFLNNFYIYMHYKIEALGHTQENELESIEVEDIIKQTQLSFKGKPDSYDFYDQANKVLSLKHGIFAHVPYLEIWAFINEVTRMGISFPLLAHILLSERNGKRFVFRSEFLFLFFFAKRIWKLRWIFGNWINIIWGYLFKKSSFTRTKIISFC